VALAECQGVAVAASHHPQGFQAWRCPYRRQRSALDNLVVRLLGKTDPFTLVLACFDPRWPGLIFAVAQFAIRGTKCTGTRELLRTQCDGCTGATAMPTIEQCRTYAAEYKILGKDQQISARRSTVLLGISRSWTALAHQLENLTAIANDEGR
jgi:hypothetical protein